MILRDPEINRLSFLLGKSRHEALSRDEYSEIRKILEGVHEHPIQLNNINLIQAGLITVGMYTIISGEQNDHGN